MPHTKQANELRTTEMLPFECEVVEGCLLGDGSLIRSGRNYRLRIRHTVRHGDYVRWKYNLLRRICITKPQYDRFNASMRVSTIGHPEITRMHKKWYESGVKVIPSELRLTPLMIAIWLMDDGTKQGNSVDFSTHCFNPVDIDVLRRELSQYDIDTTVNFDGKGHRLYVRTRSYPSFKKLVAPYIQTCMAYKLP